LLHADRSDYLGACSASEFQRSLAFHDDFDEDDPSSIPSGYGDYAEEIDANSGDDSEQRLSSSIYWHLKRLVGLAFIVASATLAYTTIRQT
jgi:hypothetical protein